MKRLKDYSYNIESQWGEDGIIEEIFKRIGDGNKTCVEFGAYDGSHLSNTWNLWFNKNWKALLIEGDTARANRLKKYTADRANVKAVQAFVSYLYNDKNTIDAIMKREWSEVKNVDLMSIDVDGDDYYIFQSITKYNPRVAIIEYNPTIPAHLDIVQKSGQYFGVSASMLVKLAKLKGYSLIEMVGTNCFFIKDEEYSKIYDTTYTLEDFFPKEFTTYFISSYGGYGFLSKKPAYDSPFKKLKMPGLLTKEKLIPVGNIIPRKNTNILNKIKRIVRGSKKIISKFFGSKQPASQQYKINTLIEYAERFNTKVLIETGTYLGTTLNAVKHHFKKIHSIELNQKLFEDVKEKFKHYSHIHLVQGDSGEKLKDILSRTNESCLFWLDGHYSGGITSKATLETPIIKGLETIFKHSLRHIILIDDARCFDGTNDYPTLKEVKDLGLKNNYTAEVRNDIIRLY